MTQPTSRRHAGATTLALLLRALIPAACGADPQVRLDALATDPMARAQLEISTDVRVTDSAGSTGSKPTPARIRRTFTVPSVEFAAAIGALAHQAEAAGWELAPRAVTGFDGTKSIEGYEAQLLILGIESQYLVWVEVSTRDS